MLFAVFASSEGYAQTTVASFTSQFDPKNFAHASFLGSGFYDVGGRQIYIVRIKSGYTLRSEQEHPWGLRLTLRPTFGFYDFDAKRFSNSVRISSDIFTPRSAQSVLMRV